MNQWKNFSKGFFKENAVVEVAYKTFTGQSDCASGATHLNEEAAEKQSTEVAEETVEQ